MFSTTSEISASDAIHVDAIQAILSRRFLEDKVRVRECLARARSLSGLTLEETAVLTSVEDPELVHEIYDTARYVKNEIYGKRLVLFAPLYYSSFCSNNCLYCGFRRDNPQPRRKLTLDEVENETRCLIDQGHKRVLVIAGEDNSNRSFGYLLDVIDRIYQVRSGRGEIRRVNVEMAPMSVDQFRELGSRKIGTYVLFQETYDPEVYRRMHLSGPKMDFKGRLDAMDRAMQAGINDVGIGSLFGLNDWRFEVLALLSHARHLDARYGAGPHTISVPRIEPAEGAPAAIKPPCPVSDADFRKLVAILRLAVPYTGIIMSTRESAEMRTELFDLGVSQISAGSRTSPGGYGESDDGETGLTAQFSLGDHRSLDEVIADIAAHGYIPSFCTGCYRLGRTGRDFMDLAKPGLIRSHCLPNAMLTFEEYLEDYATPPTRELGERLIRNMLERDVPPVERSMVAGALDRIRQGERDIYF
jgi:2-iminoacetate synthase